MTLILKVGLSVLEHHHLALKVTEELCDEQELTGSSQSQKTSALTYPCAHTLTLLASPCLHVLIQQQYLEVLLEQNCHNSWMKVRTGHE